jgi:hypothetical protein
MPGLEHEWPVVVACWIAIAALVIGGALEVMFLA